jgi:hypothetical protein
MDDFTLGPAIGIDGLIEIDPEHAGKQSDGGRKRQKQHDGPDCILRDPPPSNEPQQRRNKRNNHEPQTVADIHCAQKVARFALKPEVADRAALVHLGKTAEDGILENASHAAPGTALAENIPNGRQLCAGSHRHLIKCKEAAFGRDPQIQNLPRSHGVTEKAILEFSRQNLSEATVPLSFSVSP